DEVELNRPSGQPMMTHWMPPKYTSRPPPAVLTIAGLPAEANAEAITVGAPTTPVGEIATWSTSSAAPPPGVFRVHTTCNVPSEARIWPTWLIIPVCPVTGDHVTALALDGTTSAISATIPGSHFLGIRRRVYRSNDISGSSRCAKAAISRAA